MDAYFGKPLVNRLRANCDAINRRLWIAVPFIGNLASIRRILGSVWLQNPDIEVRLLTDIDERSRFSADTLKAIIGRGEIKHIKGLHAKIYITDDTCLLTSANLTSTAFTKRHEIGIFVDEDHSESTISIFEDWWVKAKPVVIEDLEGIPENNNPEEGSGSPSARMPTLWDLPEEFADVQYWFKPIGDSSDHIKETMLYDQVTDELYFSKNPPKSVRVGDILIT